jgi:hypothetical protein
VPLYDAFLEPAIKAAGVRWTLLRRIGEGWGGGRGRGAQGAGWVGLFCMYRAPNLNWCWCVQLLPCSREDVATLCDVGPCLVWSANVVCCFCKF